MSYYYNAAGVVGALLAIVTWIAMIAIRYSLPGDDPSAEELVINIFSSAMAASLAGACVGFFYDRLPRGNHFHCYFRAVGARRLPAHSRLAVCWSAPTVVWPFAATPLIIVIALFVTPSTWPTLALWGTATLTLAFLMALLTLPLRNFEVGEEDHPGDVASAYAPLVPLESEYSREVANSRCPRCGFGYSWNGSSCGHCNHA